MNRDRNGLPFNLQARLGELLRSYLEKASERVPMDLVKLANKVRIERPGRSTTLAALDAKEIEVPDGFDPERLAILQEAFDRAWNDLEHLSANPATHRRLIERLLVLIKNGEQNPSRLATKAVIGLVAPDPDETKVY